MRILQHILTQWEYVGSAINWVINNFEDFSKMAQAYLNTNAEIVVKNIIASAIVSLAKEVIIISHAHFLKGYHDTFFSIHFHWMKHIDKVIKKSFYLSRWISGHFLMMHTKLTKIVDELMIMVEYTPFIQSCREKITDLTLK